MYQRKNYSRGERELMVITALATHIQHGGDNQLTAYKLARKLGLEPSGHFNNILRNMVANGKLDTFTRPNKGRWTTWFFALPEGSHTPPKKSRTVNVNVKGKPAGQMELWT